MFSNNGDFMREDFTASGHSQYTIDGIDKNSPKWFKEASKKVHAAKDDDYVELKSGLLTVDQINNLLEALPLEFSYVDDNNQFLAYNHADYQKRMTPRDKTQLGEGLANCFPSRSINGVKALIHDLREGKHHVLQEPVPTEGYDFVVHFFQRMNDKNGNYAGTVEWTHDIGPLIAYYLKINGKKLVDADDANTGASKTNSETDASSGASAY